MEHTQTASKQLLVQEIATRIIGSRQITRSDQQILMSSLLSSDSLSPEEQNLVQQIYKDLKIGLIRVVE